MLGQHHVLGLAMPMLFHRISQSAVAGLAGSIFWALAAGMRSMDTLHHQGHMMVRAQGHTMGFEGVSGLLQTVVHMHCKHPTRPTRGTGHQHGGGVGPATQSHGQGQVLLECVQRRKVSGRRLWCR